jgi:YVTN family beta-propeller protein
MLRLIGPAVLGLALGWLASDQPRTVPEQTVAPALSRERHRSPAAIAVLPDGLRALTANQTANSVSLLDLEAGNVLAEIPVGHRPVCVACSADGRRAAVSNLWSGTLTLLEISDRGLRPVGEVVVGPLPRGLVFALDGRSLYVAVSGRNEVLEIALDGRRVKRRWPAPRDPRGLALSADGRFLAAASTRSGQVRCWELGNGKLVWERRIEDAFNLGGLGFTPDGQGLICTHAVRREFPVSKENIEQGWVIDSRLTRLPLQTEAVPPSAQLALDTKGAAVGDPDGLAIGPGGRSLAVAASGTHELLLLAADAIPWNAGDPGDVIDPAFGSNRARFRRVPLGGRPLAVAFRGRGDEVVVANYLLDAVQIVDARAGTIRRTIPLGGPARPGPARLGEKIFYDAGRSHHQWFSCHTCHVDGHTCGLTFDTLNDDSYGNPKLTPSLRHVTKTGPWTWHGWQKDLGAGVEKSLTQTMFGPPPSDAERRALLAFLDTLGDPPNPNRGAHGVRSAAAQHGEQLFHGKARCARCHRGEYYTSSGNYDVYLESDGSPYRLWNPPSLRGLWDRGPYLHDGRALTLEELLEKDHAPEKLGGQSLAPTEREDLVAFLKSL